MAILGAGGQVGVVKLLGGLEELELTGVLKPVWAGFSVGVVRIMGGPESG